MPGTCDRNTEGTVPILVTALNPWW